MAIWYRVKTWMSKADENGPYLTKERRFPRLDLQTEVTLRHGEEHVTLRVRNVSANGVLLACEPDRLPMFVVDAVHEIVMFDPELPSRSVTLRSKVVRHDGAGMAMTWEGDQQAIAAVSQLLTSVYSKR